MLAAYLQHILSLLSFIVLNEYLNVVNSQKMKVNLQLMYCIEKSCFMIDKLLYIAHAVSQPVLVLRNNGL